MIYLRLVEDVVVFQNLPSQRRREVFQGLTANMADLFELFITLLEQNSSALEEKVSYAMPMILLVKKSSHICKLVHGTKIVLLYKGSVSSYSSKKERMVGLGCVFRVERHVYIWTVSVI